MATLIIYDKKYITQKEWHITMDKFKYFELYKDFENEIDFENEPIKLSNITNDNFSIIYELISCENSQEVIENIDKYNNVTLIALYKITDYLIIKKLQVIIGDIIASRLNKMNIIELRKFIKLF